ncbi:hypothetical protein RHMOL_Rhmol05G0024700 [Rhododendron molle]|uniref:Uncharacterized protein n=1 Tax=Rhododendron molle TaxID=49168 RepID=A0ACC0NLB3_RHOML|nr:hypothetical protein RHMOL_Rhmol05G0024700 [Rhododendron molle]
MTNLPQAYDLNILMEGRLASPIYCEATDSRDFHIFLSQLHSINERFIKGLIWNRQRTELGDGSGGISSLCGGQWTGGCGHERVVTGVLVAKEGAAMRQEDTARPKCEIRVPSFNVFQLQMSV